MPKLSLDFLLAAVALISFDASAVSALEHGKLLHSKHCTACHGNMTGGDGVTLYIRDQRLVNSMRQLTAQVRRCAAGARANWSDEDVAAVASYLNANFYGFGK